MWTTYLANKYLDQAFRNTTYSRSTTLYYGLFTAMPSAAGGGTEVSGGAYARVAVTATTAANNFHNGSDAAMAPGESLVNKNAISWPRPTASWGDVVAYGIFDASSGGNLLWYEALPAPVTVNSFMRPSFAAGALQYTIGGACGDYLEASVLNHFFRGVAFPTIHNTARVMLGTAAGASDAFASEISPSTDGDATPAPTTSYSRCPLNSAIWTAASGGSLINSGNINMYFGTTFAGATASHWAIILDATSTFNDAPAAGNMLWFGALSTPVVIPASAAVVQTFTFGPGDMALAFEL